MSETSAKETETDFYFVDRAEPEQIAVTVLETVKTRIASRFRFESIRPSRSSA